MSHGWHTSDRRKRLPANWQRLRVLVLRRDGHRCRAYVDGSRCAATATEVDHVVNNDDHSMLNLQSLCSEHHKMKTLNEAKQARSRIAKDRKRQAEAHPSGISLYE